MSARSSMGAVCIAPLAFVGYADTKTKPNLLLEAQIGQNHALGRARVAEYVSAITAMVLQR